MGLLVIAAGAIPIGAALFADDTKFHAPRWLVAMVGGMFVLAGLMLIRSASAVTRPPATDVVGSGLGVLLTSGFTVFAGWALFLSGGPSAWNMSGSLPLWMFPVWIRVALFYVMLGVGALLCVVLTVFAWRQLVRAIASAGSGPPGPRGLE
jgi:hypothetical protein